MLQNATNRIADKGMIDRDQMADSSEARKTTESRSMFIQYYWDYRNIIGNINENETVNNWRF